MSIVLGDRSGMEIGESKGATHVEDGMREWSEAQRETVAEQFRRVGGA